MKNRIAVLLLVTTTSCQSDRVSKSDYETLKEKVVLLEDSIKKFGYYIHFTKVRPVIYKGAINANDSSQVYKAFLAADGMVIGGNVVDLKIEASDEDCDVRKVDGLYEILPTPDKDTIHVKFRYEDPKGKSTRSFPVDYPIH